MRRLWLASAPARTSQDYFESHPLDRVISQYHDAGSKYHASPICARWIPDLAADRPAEWIARNPGGRQEKCLKHYEYASASYINY